MAENESTKPEKMYTSKEAASLLGVTPRTIQLWSESGILHAHKTPGGHRRFTASELEKLTSEFNGTRKNNKRSSEQLRVLIAEDEPDLRTLYEMTLSGWELPVEVNIVKDGYEALILFGKLHPHVLILDLNMPRIDGFHMLNVINETIDSDTEVIVVTALSENEMLAHGGVPDGIAVYSKPIPFDEIENLLRDKVRSMTEQ